MTEYRQFNEQKWNEFGKGLLTGKDLERKEEKQKEFLQICRSGKTDFLNYIDEHLPCENSVIGNDPIGFEHKFSETEFLNPPEDTQKIIWNAFKDLPLEIKSSFGFWGYVIVNMIKGGSIKSDYLASDLKGIDETGVYVIDKALRPIKSKDEETIRAKAKAIDDCVRRILRSMCNPAPRGKRILFNDFSLGKSYWRWHWAGKMSDFLKLEFEQILKIFTQTHYGEFSEKMHSGGSYISQKNVLGGLLLYLQQARKGKNEKEGKEQFRKIIKNISYLSAWKAIEIQKPELNQKEIEEISKIVLPKSSP